MINFFGRRPIRLSLTLILISSLFSLATPATAFGMPDDDGNEGASASPTTSKNTDATETDCTSATTGARPPSIAYILYTSSVSFDPEPVETAVIIGPPKPIDPDALTVMNIVPRRLPALPPPAVSTAPMTAGEKFTYAMKSAFVPPGPYAQSIFSGMFNELFDNNEGKEDTIEDFFADSMTRAARSFGNRVANNFFEKFALATIFKQDPRYHRSGKTGAGSRLSYAVTRVFVTQGDRSGDQFNISYLLGGLLGATVSNVWQREENQTVGKTFRRWGVHIGLTMLTNVVREFAGGQ
ncbi:MAG TPA: hypothetical protein VNO14_16060 [Blastocatellia bacterium]|nr:hypothetical protein [Blastocatellia bacterium]